MIGCNLEAAQEETLGMIIVSLHRGHEASVVPDGVHMLRKGMVSTVQRCTLRKLRKHKTSVAAYDNTFLGTK